MPSEMFAYHTVHCSHGYRGGEESWGELLQHLHGLGQNLEGFGPADAMLPCAPPAAPCPLLAHHRGVKLKPHPWVKHE